MPQSILSLLILGVIVFFFVTQWLPLGITAVLGASAMAVFGIISFQDAYAAFGSDTVLLIFGMIVVGSTLTETGLTSLIGKKLMRIPGIGKNERLFLIVMMVAVTLISSFLSNTATVAIFLPLIAGIAKTSGGVISKKNTYMAVGIVAVVAGNLTLASSTPQIIAQGILTQTEGCEPMGFFTLAAGTIPLIIAALLYFSTFGYRLQKKVFQFDEVADENPVDQEVVPDPKKMVICACIFAWCVIGFVFGIFTLGAVAVIAACACVATGCITIKRAASTMDWTAILVLGGCVGFSQGLDQSGALRLVSNTLIDLLGSAATPYMIFCMFVLLASVLSVFMSNTATAAILVPIAITVAQGLGSNPTLFVVGVVIASGLDFVSPVGTPPITMTLSGGYRFNDYIIVGGLFNLLCLVISVIALPLIYGL